MLSKHTGLLPEDPQVPSKLVLVERFLRSTFEDTLYICVYFGTYVFNLALVTISLLVAFITLACRL